MKSKGEGHSRRRAQPAQRPCGENEPGLCVKPGQGVWLESRERRGARRGQMVQGAACPGKDFRFCVMASH